jgi:hypothetical protein
MAKELKAPNGVLPKSEGRMKRELKQIWLHIMPELMQQQEPAYCKSGKDGDCIWKDCPQNNQDEPGKTGRHCPLDIHVEERGHQ